MEEPENRGPDLTRGVTVADFPDTGLLEGHVGDDAVLLAKTDEGFLAVGARCTHYHAPLAEGLLVGATVRCPWHHGCFDLRTGESLCAPAFDPLPCWSTDTRDGTVFVTAPLAKRDAARDETPRARPHAAANGTTPGRIVIVGGGAAGFAAADMLRRCDFEGSLVMLSDDAAPPVDRPNLSKDYLSGSAPEDGVPLRPERWYRDHDINLRLGAKVTVIDARAREVGLASGERVPYDRLLLATGAEPINLDVPGRHRPHVRLLRSLKDANGIIAAAHTARRVVVIGASFIGLEVAASLRARNLDVHVVARERRPLAMFGPAIADFVRALHEERGVVFHLQDTVAAVEEQHVVLKSGTRLDADLVVVGIGVRPRTTLAERAGLAIDRGVTVSPLLETSAPGVFAAGDIARWPDPHTGEKIRLEHWVVAERQGQAAARNMLGAREPFEEVPFFWSQHYDIAVNYVGHAAAWDQADLDGDPQARNCSVRYSKGGRFLAMASIFRDVDSLKAEMELAGQRAAGD